MSIGVDYQTFWAITPRELQNEFTEAYFNRKKQIDENLHLSGFYTYNATVSAIARTVNGDKKAKYVEKPVYTYHAFTKKQQEQVKEMQRQEQVKAQVEFMNKLIDLGNRKQKALEKERKAGEVNVTND